MPSPFPGMDPFLEDPAIFPDLHDRFVAQLSEALNARLPRPYFSAIASRIWIEASFRRIGPDINVLRPKRPAVEKPTSGGTGVATAEAVATEPVVVRVAQEEVRETYLEVFARRGKDRLVAAIEVLSPTNKTPGAKGRSLYRRKQRSVLRRRVHLIEIDLLRSGNHSTAVPFDAAQERTGGFDYHVCVRAFNRLEDYFIYPIRLPQRLPTLAVPLLPEDSPIPIDLQSVLNRCYEIGRYDLRIDYNESVPPPALSAERQAFVDQILHSHKLADSGSASSAAT